MIAQPTNAVQGSDLPEEDALRADMYGFLASLLAAPPDAGALQRCAALGGDETAIGQGLSALAGRAAEAKPQAVAREFNRLFIGVGRGELLPYASFYLTGFLNEKPLAHLREDMGRLGIARSAEVSEPEDHIATLCEMMAGLIRGQFAAPRGLRTEAEFFTRHMARWAGHFFSDLEAAKEAHFYVPVGRIGRAFMDIEAEVFRMGE